MSVGTQAEVEALRTIGRIVAQCLRAMRERAAPGMTTRELDDIGRAFLQERGARSAPELVYAFPGATCISVNHEVAHGVPGDTKLAAGDLVNVDVSAELDGYFADTGGSFILSPVTPRKSKVCEAAREALNEALKVARAGRPINEIGRAIERIAKRENLTIIRNLGSHGVGRGLHEEPDFIAGYYEPRDKRTLRKGQVITIEPFLSDGATEAILGADGWTLTAAGHYSAQHEHSMIITDGAPIILTAV